MTSPSSSPVVALIGLGYVGLPLVVKFGKQTRTMGFDNVEDKVAKVVRNGCFVDVKARFDAAALEAAGLTVWRL